MDQKMRSGWERVLLDSGAAESVVEECRGIFENQGWLSRVTAFGPVNKGMTNRLFYFEVGETAYLLRLAGEGSEHLVDRNQESWIYHKLQGRGITDPFVYMNPESGIKISQFIGDAHSCDIQDMEEVRRCMRHLAHFHDLKIKGQVYFDLFEKLEEYEKTCAHDIRDYFPDYPQVRGNIWKLKEIIAQSPVEYCVCHVDPVPDNFLIRSDKVFLIDWEYAAMADPHMDVAMFCIYAGYGREQVDQVIDLYFKDGCSAEIRRKIYCYIACAGLLWTVWCEIKRDSGVLFEEYERIQYQYAIDYYRYVMDGRENG